jgi:hypothetical protein
MPNYVSALQVVTVTMVGGRAEEEGEGVRREGVL